MGRKKTKRKVVKAKPLPPKGKKVKNIYKQTVKRKFKGAPPKNRIIHVGHGQSVRIAFKKA